MDLKWSEIMDFKNKELDMGDTRTGLTKRERLIVQYTWRQVWKIGAEDVGIALFDL